ncbi:MAG: pyruvate kinase [Candidatus Peribacteraceae bacterium]|nr:pyruvate kinase [Candidatus Peribacteraceae bacterium]
MNPLSPARPRLTKIICSLGPTSQSEEQVRALLKAGMNVARINLSHGSHEDHTHFIDLLQKLCGDGSCIPIIIDTRGSAIRTGTVQTSIPIKEGQTVVFSSVPLPGEKRPVIEVNYKGFAKDVRGTEQILVDNGQLSFELISIEENGAVVAKALDSGAIGSRRHINLPGADVDLPSITEKDWDDIAFGITQGIDFIALSFIRNAEEVKALRRFLNERKSDVQIITKIETRRAVAENLGEIIEVSDGIMVARGDLGTEIPIEELPAFQDEIVARCRDTGKPVIVATQMLESMIVNPLPTRAEATDISHAAATRADATMLSGETANGRYPVKCVETMDRILRQTEAREARLKRRSEGAVHNDYEARAEAAVTLAQSTHADVIFAFTKTGRTARDVTRFRPTIPVIACTPHERTRRKLALFYGVFPLLTPFSSPEGTVHAGMEAAKKAGLVDPGMRAILLSDTQAKDAPVSTVQMRDIS